VPFRDTCPVTAPPTFASLPEYISRVDDVEFWRPYVTEILGRHDLAEADREPVAGFNATYPTFVCGDVVIKLFGYTRAWRAGHAAERAAYALISTDPEIAAPSLLGDGRLYDNANAEWSYLITTRVSGVASWCAELSADQQRSLAAQLGGQVRRIHALSPSEDLATEEEWPALDVAAAAQRSSLPPHLVAQVDDYIAQLGPSDRVFVHGDLLANHVYVEDGRITGIIDWGDAMVTDRHAELIQVFRDMFDCDKALLRVFLEASDWPIFEPVAALLPLEDFGTLDELATESFELRATGREFPADRVE
jgi:hygromycin-B 7''-O-kinase